MGSALSAIPWPFSVRPSLENLADPNIRHVVAASISEVGFAILLLSIAVLVGRARVVATLIALPLIFMNLTTFTLFLVPATPTSYHQSPSGFSATSIASGSRVFASTCATCHGKAGDGVGGLGEIADLRRAHIWTHPGGDLFWFISNGINGPDGAPLMPAFGTILPERTRWALIDYVYALNAGAVTRGLDGWPHRMPAPSLEASCRGTEAARSIGDLRGKVVRVILGALPRPLDPVPPVNGIQVVTVWLPGPETEAAPDPAVDCVAHGGADEATAYAILAGSADGQVVAARFLIDPEGVLRSVWRREDGNEWTDPGRLLEEVRTICTEPLTIETGDEHDHHH